MKTCSGKRSMIGLFLILTLLHPLDAFELFCPSPEQWYLRANVNCLSIEKYTCLPDFSDQMHNESCRGPIVALPGERRVSSNKNFDIKPCTSERYQPVTFSSKQGSDCLFKKGKCSDEGQVIYGNGTSKMDRTCRCDYTRGFVFMSTDRTDPCSCITATEDCSCYKKECNETQILSPDYKCINETQQGNYSCSSISGTESVKSIPDVVPVNDDKSIGYIQVYRFFAASCCAISIVLFILVFIKVYWDVPQALRKRFEKDYFVDPLEAIAECFEGENVTLSCKVNKEKTTGTWFKDGKILDKESSDIQCLAEGKCHKLEILNVKIEHRGYYTLHIKQIVSSSLLLVLGKVTQEEMNYLRLIYLLETVAEPVVRKIFDREFHPQQLRKTLDQNKRKKVDILRNKKHLNRGEYNLLFPSRVVEYCIKFKLQRYDYHKTKEKKKRKLANTIENAVSSLYSNVDGNHKVSFTTFEPGSMVVVLKLSSHNNYDFQNLKNIIQTAVIDDRNIGNLKTESTGFSFIELGDTSVPISSEDFDIRLMTILMRNLADFDISKKLPLDVDKSESADLSRITSIRNDIIQNSDKQISDVDFEKNWKQLTEAVIRRERKYEIVCEELKKFNPSPRESQKYLQSKNMESNSQSLDSLNKWKELINKQSIQKVARDAVQKIFDEQFPPETLRTAIRDRFEFLSNLKDQKKITESEWKNLRSAEHENVSSGTFDTKLMIMLLKDSQLKETSRLKGIEHLNNLLSKTDLDFLAIRQALTEVSGEDVDFK